MTSRSGLASNETSLIRSVRKELLIAGEWVQAGDRGTLPVEDPATGRVLCQVADATPDDAQAALASAAAVQGRFASLAPRDRAGILRRAHDLMLAREEELSLLTTLEMGKPLAEARAEVQYAADFLLWFSEEAMRVAGSHRVSPSGGGRILTSAEPVGPSLLITPWNFPLAMVTRKIGPAVAAGCTMVLKPAAETPLGALAVGGILLEAGLPPEALGILVTSRPDEVAMPLLADVRLRKVSFTGSTEVGRKLLAAAAPNVLRSSMELGGNAPFLVFPDTDMDAVIAGAMRAKLRNTGQSCTAANRFLVHECRKDEFVDRLACAMHGARIGRGTEADVELGPLIGAAACKRLAGLVERAAHEGADVHAGRAAGEATGSSGAYFAPTVLGDVAPGSDLVRHELFGPIAPVLAFRDEDEAIAMANATEHGLVAFVYTESLTRALRVSGRLETGMVGINQGVVSNAAAPFGGVKHSGLGREGGFEGIAEYLETKYVAIPAA